MAETPSSHVSPDAKPSLLRALMRPAMFSALLMGFTSGLPFLLTLRTLQAWMTDAGVDLKTIGVFALAGLPYTFKFVWSPLLDRFSIGMLGRRRGWMAVSQCGLIVAILAMGMTDPVAQTFQMALLAVCVAFFSATQDIVVDAYRRESLKDEELGLGSTLYVYGYRLAMLISGAFALGMAEYMPWGRVYMVMAGVMGLGLLVTLLSKEPETTVKPPATLRAAVVEPFQEFLGREGALWILAFVLLFKLGDTMAGAMSTPFYLKIGFDKITIAAIAKTFGTFANLGGSFLGGVLVLRMGLTKALWVSGILQAVSVLALSGLALVGPDKVALTIAIAFEDLAAGMGTAAFVAFMGSMTSRRYTATQYALLSSLMGVPRTLLSVPTGWLAQSLGWPVYFMVCAVCAIPGLLLIQVMARLQQPEQREEAPQA